MDRADLHRLVDTLPEGALENAQRILDHLQVWPPQLSPEMGRIRQIQQERLEQMRRSMKPGTAGGGGGGGGFDPTTGYGHSGHTHWEDGTLVHEAYHFFKGHEIAVTERLRFTDDHYGIEAKGPNGDTYRSDWTFAIA